MPVKVYDEAEKIIAFALLESQLAFALDNAGVDQNFQAHLATCGVTTLARFVHMAEDVVELKKVLEKDLGLVSGESMALRLICCDVVNAWTNAKALLAKKCEMTAEARVSETALAVGTGDHKVMLAAYTAKHGKLNKSEVPGRYFLGTKIEEVVENEPKPELLTEVSCKQDHESDIWTPCFNEQGQVRTRKGSLTKVAPPIDGDDLRRRHRLIGNAWIMAHMNHTNRPWLKNVTPKTWSDFTDFVMGELVAKFQVELPNGKMTALPAWSTVLHYEFQIRKAAYELVAEGVPMEKALESAMKDGNLRQLHFTTPCQFALNSKPIQQVVRNHTDLADNIRNAFPAIEDRKVPKGKAKGKGKKGVKGGKNDKVKKGKGGKAKGVCYAFNNGTACDANCGFNHICQTCKGEHPRTECPNPRA